MASGTSALGGRITGEVITVIAEASQKGRTPNARLEDPRACGTHLHPSQSDGTLESEYAVKQPAKADLAAVARTSQQDKVVQHELRSDYFDPYGRLIGNGFWCMVPASSNYSLIPPGDRFPEDNPLSPNRILPNLQALHWWHGADHFPESLTLPTIALPSIIPTMNFTFVPSEPFGPSLPLSDDNNQKRDLSGRNTPRRQPLEISKRP
ncbi:hypothetical protein FB451DRAFT_1168301 [Mycena latifolia]|nr:hypothetical protein FB451DRAFT_1168301 [Mycena latifolia]